MSLYSVKFPHKKIEKKSLPKRFLFIANSRFIHLSSGKETLRCARRLASFTLEAAVLMPLLASFFVSILFFFRVMQVQVEVQKALEDTTRELAVAFATNGREEDYLLAKTLFVKNMKGRENAQDYVTGGTLGIHLGESSFEGDEVYLRAEYQMKLPISILGKQKLAIIQSASGRKWLGWNPSDTYTDTWVYITESGTVYHLTRTCTYLDLSIQTVSESEIETVRNKSGGKYRCCKHCAEESGILKQVYITAEGDCYHTDINCSGLKRTVRQVRLSEVAGWRCCSRCCGARANEEEQRK